MNSNFQIIDNILPCSAGRDGTSTESSMQGVKKTFSVLMHDEPTQQINTCDTISDCKEKQTENQSKGRKSNILPVADKGRNEQTKSDEDPTVVSMNQNCGTDEVANVTDGTEVLSNLSETPLLYDNPCNLTSSEKNSSRESHNDSQQLVSTIVTSATVSDDEMPILMSQGIEGDEIEMSGFDSQQLESDTLSTITNTISPDLKTISQEGNNSGFQSLPDENLIDSQNNMQMNVEQGASDANFQAAQTQDSKNSIENSLIELLQSPSLIEKDSAGRSGTIRNIANGIKDIRASQSEINTAQYINRESDINAQFELQKSLLEQITSTKDAGTTSRPVQDLSSSFASDVGKQILDSIQSSLTGQGINNNITVRLNPPELGNVVIKFQGKETQLTGLLEVSNAQTRTAVEQALPQLVKNLADSGIEIKRLDVVLSNNTQSDSHTQKENLFNGEHQQQNWYDDGYVPSILNVADGENRQSFSINPAENNSMNNSSLAGDYLNILL